MGVATLNSALPTSSELQVHKYRGGRLSRFTSNEPGDSRGTQLWVTRHIPPKRPYFFFSLAFTERPPFLPTFTQWLLFLTNSLSPKDPDTSCHSKTPHISHFNSQTSDNFRQKIRFFENFNKFDEMLRNVWSFWPWKPGGTQFWVTSDNFRQKIGFFENFDKFDEMLRNFWPFWPWKLLFFDAFHWKTPYFCVLCHWKTPFFDAFVTERPLYLRCLVARADPRMVRIGIGPLWQINHANSAYFRLFLGYFRVISATRPPFWISAPLFTYPGSAPAWHSYHFHMWVPPGVIHMSCSFSAHQITRSLKGVVKK